MQSEGNKTKMIYVESEQEREKINVEYENDPKKYMANGKFDSVSFNKDFGIVLKRDIAKAETIEENKLNDYNGYYNALAEEEERKKKYDSTINSLSFSKILVKWGDTIKNIFADIIKGNYNAEEFIYIFIKDDRLIYLGMTLILIGILGYVINQYLLDDNNSSSNGIYVTTNNYLSETPKQPDVINALQEGITPKEVDMSKVNLNVSEQLKKL